MLRLLQVNELGHIPYGKKRAFLSANKDRRPRVYLNSNRQYDRPKIFHEL